MKTLREWRNEQNQHTNADMLLNNLKELGETINSELKNYTGERFEGIISLIGAVNEINRTIAEIEHGTISSRPKWASKLYEWQLRNEPQQRRRLNEGENREEFSEKINQLVGLVGDEISKYAGEEFPGLKELKQSYGEMVKAMP